MNRNIYALLVGIDEYISPVPALKGCVNDITAVKEYLSGRVATDGYQLHLRTLLNRQIDINDRADYYVTTEREWRVWAIGDRSYREEDEYKF